MIKAAEAYIHEHLKNVALALKERGHENVLVVAVDEGTPRLFIDCDQGAAVLILDSLIRFVHDAGGEVAQVPPPPLFTKAEKEREEEHPLDTPF